MRRDAATLLFCLILITACSHPELADVGVEGSNAPTFTLYGDGRLRSFEIYEYKAQPDGGEVLTLVWSVWKYRDEPRLKEVGTISYGVVPQGYEQYYPHGDHPPQPLDPKQSYKYWLRVDGKVEVMELFHYDGSKWMNSMAH